MVIQQDNLPRLTLDQLSFERGNKTVLASVSGCLEAGKIYALVGPNGAGKSTLLQCLAQLLKHQGQIGYHGGASQQPEKQQEKHQEKQQEKTQDWSAMSHEQRARLMAYLPQHSQLQFPLTVREVVALATLPFDLSVLAQRQQLKQILHDWGLTALADKDFRQLSGGEQQRCQLARTHWQLRNTEAGIWLLDEPTSSLDLEHQQQLQAVCQQAASHGHTVVLVLHDLNRVMAMADEVWLLERGVIRAQGACLEVMQPELLSQVFKVQVERLTQPSGAVQLVFS